MTAFARIREYLGLDKPVIHNEFRANARTGTMPVCRHCGALVAFESQELHTDWHSLESR
ncbi:MAG: hypothetical protein Q4P23_11285 [Micrococcaceae bacterium]|nr:hypothetical protein [Micrococcaceae bacterium]